MVPPTTLNAAVDSALSDIVMRSLERDKAARFQTAQEMERALSRYLATTAAETDVGAWMHTLFPIESGRTESTEFREPRIPIRLEGGTGGGPVPAASNVLSTPPRPQLQSDAPPAGSSPSGTGWDAQTARTPVAQTLAREPATRTTAPPAREGKRGVFVALGAGLAGVLATLAVVLFLSPKQTVVRPALPVEAPPARPQQLLPPVVAKPAPEPPPPSIASAPARKPKPPAVHKHSAAKPALAPAAAAPVATPAPVVAKPLPPTGPGMLVLFVSPAGDVLIDGKFQRRQDGRAEYELTPGTHQLEVRGPPAWKKAIVVEASQKTWEWAYR